MVKVSRDDELLEFTFTCVDSYGDEVYLRLKAARSENGEPMLLLVGYSERLQVMYEDLANYRPSKPSVTASVNFKQIALLN